jgi:hypothetical protein
MQQVKQLLSQPSEQNGETSAALLREVEIQLGCAVAILKTRGCASDPEIRSTLEGLQGEIAVLAQFFAEADKLLAGWLRAIGTRKAGYTTHGGAAPLVLVNKVSVEG